MHGASPGDPQYFVEEDFSNFGNALRVVAGSNLLSSSPSFTETKSAGRSLHLASGR